MKSKLTGLSYGTALFPGVLSGIFFVLFLFIDQILTERLIHPHPYFALLFAIPSICFAVIAWQRRLHSSKTPAAPLYHLTVALVFAWTLPALIIVPFLWIHDSIATVTNIESYDRVIRLSCFRDDLISDFPKNLPADAKNANLYYAPFAIGQGGQEIAVGFQADADTIAGYTKIFSNTALWIGRESDPEAGQHSVFVGDFSQLGAPASGLTNDFTVYVISEKPYSKSWNHGESSLVAISTQKNEIYFWASKW